MPIKIPDQLPALSVLASENIFVMSDHRAANQDIRPMQVAILNLMPNKIETEIQILRMLSNTPLQVNVELIRIHANESKHTPTEHLDAFYRLFDDIKHKQYDGLVITGAPLALMDYEQVTYWDKICEVFDWAKDNVTSTLYSCWAAHAAMYYYHRIKLRLREQKLSGVFMHQTLEPTEPLIRGFDSQFEVPHSRYGQIAIDHYLAQPDLQVLASSEEGGAYIVASKDRRQVFLTGHPEYDATTLAEEYQRDVNAGIEVAIPEHYFIDNDPNKEPRCNWRSHGCLLFTNWLNYYVYQITPYQLDSDHMSPSGFTFEQ